MKFKCIDCKFDFIYLGKENNIIITMLFFISDTNKPIIVSPLALFLCALK